MKKHRNIPTFLKVIAPLIPLLLAFVAYLQIYSDGAVLNTLSDALYSAVRIYGISIDKPLNGSFETYTLAKVLLEFARWGAIGVMATAVYKLLQNLFLAFRTSLVARHPHSVALYGDEAPVAQMKKELGGLAITENAPNCFRAASQVLAFHDAKNMYRFLSAHQALLFSRPDANVFLYSNSPLHPAVLKPHIHIHNTAEACARTYWKKHWLKVGETRIVLIGDDLYAQELLTHALQNNVFLSHADIEYHLFGDWTEYRALHPQLNQVVSVDCVEPGKDSIVFHQEAWYEQLGLLRQVDRVIVCAPDEQVRIIGTLLESKVHGRIDVRIDNAHLLELFGYPLDEGKSSILPFGTDDELFALDQVTNVTTLSKGRLIHASYYREECLRKETECEGRKNLTACLNCPQYIDQWNHATVYQRSSSMAQGDHIAIKVRELLHLQETDVSPRAQEAFDVYSRLSETERNRFLDLEHRRWMRFMFLHGWRYAPVRNDDELQHPLLVPFDELTSSDQQKDGQAYEILPDVAVYAEFKKERMHNV